MFVHSVFRSLLRRNFSTQRYIFPKLQILFPYTFIAMFVEKHASSLYRSSVNVSVYVFPLLALSPLP